MATAEYRRSSSLWIWAGIIALITAAFFGIRSLTREQVEVRVAPVTHQNLLSTVSTNGKVEPVEEFQAHAPYPGVIDRIYVEVGQHVKPGTPLLRMADADVRARLATASTNLVTAQHDHQQMVQGGALEERNRFQADIDAAKTEQESAARNLTLVQQLQQRGSASASEVAAARQRADNADMVLKNAQLRATGRYAPADLSTSKARVEDAAAALAAAKSNLADANISSPIVGTVYSIPVSEYDYVPGGDDLMDVADLNRIQVRAYFDEPEIGKLLAGQAVKIVWDAKPNREWHGHILRAPTTVIPYGTRSVGECLITVDDAKEDLLPNTNVTVTVTTSERFNVLSIPREALHIEGANNFVYRVINNKLVRTPVKIDSVNLTRVQVLSGLTEKDTVALSATSNHDLANGLEVKPVE
ncbi:efflux RND transporter periplasmic adaptor subunit [Granulicella sp. WH15]|uniref:efflux RND transporter periplasmic adaptor subunit n=1 Tax=Granulicella sp. WH15 TaxID=2602070 RepID=UPI001366E148|nr:efflux RND transporter periplasmic adaptor subunit [Granulicella sp. WH15]QHN04029.1 efflux RND transporter periplasmic adaptor subunit [Granulicella sp. WH15]